MLGSILLEYFGLPDRYSCIKLFFQVYLELANYLALKNAFQYNFSAG